MTTKVMVVESDGEFADEIGRALKGRWPALEMRIIGDGQSALQVAAESPPDLILLRVELPKVSGYSICNKLKKNPQLRNIPLVIISTEATPEIFEQHSKLRTRAEAYLIKPFPMGELLAKIEALVPLSQQAALARPMGASLVELEDGYEQTATGEPSLADEGSDLVVREGEVMAPEGDPTHVVDRDIDVATDAAFAALEVEEDEEPAETIELSHSGSSGVPFQADQVTLEVADMGGGDERVRRLAELTAEPEYIPVRMETSGPSRMESAVEVLDPEDVVSSPFVATDPQAMLFSSRQTDDSPAARLREQLRQLENENEELRQSLQEAEARARKRSETTTSGLSRDRELLGLREVINKKEKEVLDLKDDLDAKERQVLDHKDKVRELERRLRDMDEKLLVVEREVVTAKEKLEAQLEDKQNLLERERGVKARLEQAKAEIEKGYAENQQIKQRAEEEQRRLVQQHEKAIELARAEAEEQRRQLEIQQQQLLAQQQQEHEGRLADRERELERSMGSLVSEHQRRLREERERHDTAISELTRRHQEALERSRAEHASELGQLRSQHEAAFADEREEHRLALAQQEDRHQRALSSQQELHGQELEQAQAAHDEALQALKISHQQAQEQLEAEYAAERESLRWQHAGELDRVREEGQRALALREAELNAQLAQEREEQRREVERLGVEHERQLAELHERNQAAERALQERIRGLEEDLQARAEEAERERRMLEQTIGERDHAIAQLQSDLADARLVVADRERQISEHETQAESLRRQLAQAFQRMHVDGQLAQKAKRALGVAIALLDQSASDLAADVTQVAEGDTEASEHAPEQ